MLAQDADGLRGDLTTTGFVAAVLGIVVSLVTIIVRRWGKAEDRLTMMETKLTEQVAVAVAASEARCRVELDSIRGDLTLALSGLQTVATRYPQDRDVELLLTALRERNHGKN